VEVGAAEAAAAEAGAAEAGGEAVGETVAEAGAEETAAAAAKEAAEAVEKAAIQQAFAKTKAVQDHVERKGGWRARGRRGSACGGAGEAGPARIALQIAQ
jgi:hypothetical protein